MRRILLTALSALLLTACASDEDKVRPPPTYGNVGSAEAAPDIDVGTWSGPIGSRAATLVVADDGSGLLCFSTETKETVRRVRYHAGLLLVDDGTGFSISDANGETMKIQGFEAEAGNYVLHSDADLKLASAACGKRIAKMR